MPRQPCTVCQQRVVSLPVENAWYSLLDYVASYGGGGGKTGVGFGDFFLIRGRDVTCMIMVGCAKDKVGGKSKVIYPVSMSSQGTDEGASDCVPNFNRLVLRRSVNFSGATPADT